MKFAVFLLTYLLSEIHCVTAKVWSSGGYKNEYFCSVEWGDYLKRLSLVIFMVSGVALYYVPKFRIYFHKGCHGVVDFVADGLKTVLNVSDTECTSDCTTSYLSHRGSLLRLEKKNPLANPHFSKIHRNENHLKVNKYPRYYGTNEAVEKFKNSLRLPCETIQLYPKNGYEKFVDCKNTRNKDSDSSDDVRLPSNKNRRQNRSPEKSMRNHKLFNSLQESEPTNYPEDLSINDRTESDESEENYPRYEDEYSYDLIKRKKLERRLFEFDRTLRNLRSLFLRKYSTKFGGREEYPAYLIEGILESLKRNFTEIEEDSQKMVQKHYRKSRGIDKTSLTRGIRKIVPLDRSNHQLVKKLSKTDNHTDFHSISTKNRKFRSNYSKNIVQATLSRKGTTVFLWDLKKR